MEKWHWRPFEWCKFSNWGHLTDFSRSRQIRTIMISSPGTITVNIKISFIQCITYYKSYPWGSSNLWELCTWCIYGWFCLATAKICCSWWKLRFSNSCHFYPVKQTLWKSLCLLFGFVSTQIFNLGQNFFSSSIIKKYSEKQGWTPFFGRIFDYWKKNCLCSN